MFGSRQECYGKNICRCRLRYLHKYILPLLTLLFLVVKLIKELQKSPKIINKMIIVSLCLFIIPVNINGLNYLIKRYRTSKWILKN